MAEPLLGGRNASIAEAARRAGFDVSDWNGLFGLLKAVKDANDAYTSQMIGSHAAVSSVSGHRPDDHHSYAQARPGDMWVSDRGRGRLCPSSGVWEFADHGLGKVPMTLSLTSASLECERLAPGS